MDARRAQLIEHGLELFGTRPYDEVAIEDIAARANVSKGLLYHYFGGKRAFYLEVVRNAAQALLEAVEPDPDLPPLARGLNAVHAYLEFVEHNAKPYATLVTGGLGADAEVAAIIETARMAFVGRILLGLGLSEPRPVFRLVLRGWIGGVEAMSLQWLATRDVPRDVFVRVILLGMRSTLQTALDIDPKAEVDLSQFEVPES